MIFLKLQAWEICLDEMLKQARSTTAKVREICHQYPNEFGETPAGDV